MLKKIAKYRLGDSEISRDLKWWLSRPPAERIDAVKLLRRKAHGDTGRLQRVIRITEREKS